MDIAYLLGIVVGKALFDRIPLDCFLTRAIWRQICGQKVELCDFYSYDSQMYKNLKLILETPNAEDLFLNFTYFVGDELGKQEQVVLKQNGENIGVDDSNKK
jgi:E3 ubiquitin-protein ligase HUWE1